MKLPAWTREPLVQFLFGGALLFVFFAWRGEPADPASRDIEVSRDDQAQLAVRFEALMRRPPTDAELDNLIEQYLREEILYREALRLGLDQDDPVVRRRLSQKMDEIAGARAETAPVTDAMLQEWIEAHPERFAADATYSFDQLWFSEGDEAALVLAQLTDDENWQGLGGEISLPASLENASFTDIENRFGQAFSTSLNDFSVSPKWYGPVSSGFGWHLVRVRKKQIGEVPELADIRSDVENDWRSSTIADRKKQAYELLREAYDIDIER
ncbi:peptidyl-prolyl cis-trans isomerase [Altererythrobacter sp. MF3-039]|uniref:peptidyl-prolyl cis-trans isomerase n=1 Tax=Altererythrobacter sp. MF3-039 TaxID=3252901 RepID=UPI00390C8887